MNFIDTAQGYGDGKSERVIAQVLKQRRGEKVYVATKIPPTSPGAWPPSPYDRADERYRSEDATAARACANATTVAASSRVASHGRRT